ncbi:hypothetical protein A9W98_14520 [Mycobacterium gordonae]|uniref:Uncharacterized protein n=1 Tax=Mycobacterium gordonae TaxID=1778 RepID=A0A1A6BJH7_MYCGO|nr:hypothetical protein [Mycobacterium gordonae]OBS02502.1 hypothetical protein A9W98_14520 [Mycobacterium gordonae]
MRRITIERYSDPEDLGYAGLVEGTRDDGTTWIMWLDESGNPTLYWGSREDDGTVVGEPVPLA